MSDTAKDFLAVLVIVLVLAFIVALATGKMKLRHNARVEIMGAG